MCGGAHHIYPLSLIIFCLFLAAPTGHMFQALSLCAAILISDRLPDLLYSHRVIKMALSVDFIFYIINMSAGFFFFWS